MSKAKAYSYMRFSTSRQESGDSLRRQTELAESYATANNLDLDDSLRDLGVSAFRGANQDGALGRFIEMAEKGEVDRGSYLLVESHDRLSRQDPDQAMFQFLRLLAAGVIIVTLADNQVYRKGGEAMSLMQSLMVMGRANDESKAKSMRASAAWERNRLEAAEGKHIKNAYCPQWLVWKGDRLEPKDEAVAVVRRMFELSKSGHGLAAIARILNDDGVLTFRKRTQWRSAGVGDILRNRATIGEYQPHQRVETGRVPIGEPLANYYPAVVSISDFTEVQRGIANRRNSSTPTRRGQCHNLFSSCIRCQCGESMRYHNKGKKNAPRNYLVCPRKDDLGCDMPMIRYDRFEPQALIAMSHLTVVMNRDKKDPHSGELAEINDRLGVIKQQSDRLLMLIIEHDDNPSIKERFTSLDSERKELEDRRQKLIEAIETASVADKAVRLLTLDKLDTVGERQRFNAQLRQMIAPIELRLWGEEVVAVYRSVEGALLLEQQFSDKAMSSRVIDDDGHDTIYTTATAPYVNGQMNELFL
ncbi:recombinase family protein [Shewanella eurypsychrophilus]|uniref:Recombinase family protein n=1 Tax=Shewanella eurypsychrophilus TaxID=2593656 RepID=A0ABX6V7C2_9GAMM|nr:MULTISPECIES: recombinase family protein [Shewanella]QPG58293.2 recombinase family protein [Shewanella eurypsychrophilus]